MPSPTGIPNDVKCVVLVSVDGPAIRNCNNIGFNYNFYITSSVATTHCLSILVIVVCHFIKVAPATKASHFFKDD